MTKEALELMVEQANSSYIPVGIMHDPRIPPVGRIISAKLVQLEDGEYAVEGVRQIFEVGDEYEIDEGTRELPLDYFSDENLAIQFDRGFRDKESQEAIAEISKAFNSRPQEQFKKSADPISVLVIVGTFLLGGIASGFLGKIGSDAFDLLKEKLKQLFLRKKKDRGEFLLSFEFTISDGASQINVETILSNPTEEDIEHFLGTGLSQGVKKMNLQAVIWFVYKRLLFQTKHSLNTVTL